MARKPLPQEIQIVGSAPAWAAASDHALSWPMLSGKSCRGRWRAPWMCPSCHSVRRRASIRIRAGSSARTVASSGKSTRRTVPSSEGWEAQVAGFADVLPGGPVDADAREAALELGDLLLGRSEQGDWRAPGDQPAEVGDGVALDVEAQAPGEVLGGPEPALAQVDHPFTGLDPPAQLLGVGDAPPGVRSIGRAPCSLAGPMCL